MVVVDLRFGQVIILLHLLRLFRHNVHQRHNLAALREAQVGLHMGVGNVARTHNGNPNHGIRSFFNTQRCVMRYLHDSTLTSRFLCESCFQFGGFGRLSS